MQAGGITVKKEIYLFEILNKEKGLLETFLSFSEEVD